jgi:ubiquinone/menaquinone biosynthesis C-methylase UbiE
MEDAPSTSTSRYDAIAEFYEGFVGDDLNDPAALALLELLPDLNGRHVLDLACGQGRLSRELARCGARVVGIDISAVLLEQARGRESSEPLGITYLRADAASAMLLDDERFDLVACHFGLSDIDDLGGVVANAARLLLPGGFLVFSIVHPCFPGWGDDAPSSWPPGESYFAEKWWLAANSGIRGKVGSTHRMLSTYLNVLREHGLAVDRVLEPPPDPEWVRRKNPSDDLVPVFLVVRCRRENEA